MGLGIRESKVEEDQTLVQSSTGGVHWWNRISLSIRFLLAAGIVLLCAMAVLAGWVGERVKDAAIAVAAATAAPHLHSLLQPIVLDPLFPESLSSASRNALDGISEKMHAEDGVVAVKLWTVDGVLLYSTLGGEGGPFDVSEVRRASQGEVVASFEGLDHSESEPERHLDLPLIEIYVPLYLPDSGTVAAVGEIYENAATLHDKIAEAQVATWTFVGGTTLTILAVLFLIVHGGSRTIAEQAAALEAQLVAAERLAATNQELVLQADQARLDASRTNEELLARIGADIHDGPVQLLTLLLLNLPEDAGGATGSHHPIELGKRTIAELRIISAGLVLPEIESMTLDDSLRLAVSRHEQMTGTIVETDIADLPGNYPIAVRTCLYRVVQESLSNAYRHARGAATRVTASATDAAISIVVQDDGPGLDGTSRQAPIEKLGLVAMRNRVAALRGSLVVESRPNEGVRLSASIPLDTNRGTSS
jgi:signal transduction histidine kinase